MSLAETWRLFVALTLPDAVRREIESLQTAWRSALPKEAIRWTRGDQLHLTLKFLGDIEAGRVRELTEALQSTSRAAAPLRLVAQGTGAFPNERSPRVLWVGLGDSEGRLAGLQRGVETAVTGFGRFESAGPFAGHITLGRVRDDGRSISGAVKALVSEAAGRKFGEWTADTIDLIRSELSADGARHTRLAELRLGRGAASA